MPFSIAGRDHDFCHVVVQPKQWQVVAIERFPLDRTIQGDESSFNFVDKFVNSLLRAVGVIPAIFPSTALTRCSGVVPYSVFPPSVQVYSPCTSVPAQSSL